MNALLKVRQKNHFQCADVLLTKKCALDGGGGGDILMGGAGNDTYYADNLDTIFDTAGIDTVITTSSLFTLTDSSNVENLTYSGVADVCYMFGNNLKNVFVKNQLVVRVFFKSHFLK